MEVKERIKQAIKNADYNIDNLDKIISIAYFMGRESKAVEMGDRVKALLSRMRDRANKCRYHNMAHAIIDDDDITSVGVMEILYDHDYSRDETEAFSYDETNV